MQHTNHPPEEILVTKFSGEKVVFSVDKLRHSLERTGAGNEVVNAVIGEVKKRLFTGISTKKIYREAFLLLKKHSGVFAGKYNIKNALMDLGPSGFPFEKYVAELLKYRGYTPVINQFIQGACVTHEVDIVAYKEKVRCMIECKFHNRQGVNCDVKIPLYIHSRFRDIESTWQAQDPDITNEGWVVTNTKFTDDAITYGVCAGLKLLGWNYPRKNNLQQLIEASGLYPITILNSMTSTEKQQLMAGGTVLCRDIDKQVLSVLGISDDRAAKILKESSMICGS